MIYWNNNTSNLSRWKSVYEKELMKHPRGFLRKYLENVVSGKLSGQNKKRRARFVLSNPSRMSRQMKNQLVKNANYRNLPKQKPLLRRAGFNAPRIKRFNTNISNLSNYMNMRKKIIKQTNIPGAYQLRRLLLEKLNRQVRKFPRENFLSLNEILPSRNTHYILKNGNHPGTWLYLTPNSYHELALRAGRGGVFRHPTTYKMLKMRNFKFVKRF